METEVSLKNETTLSYSLPISLIRQYSFCPRIPYYLELLQLRPETPLWVNQGGEYHVTMERLLPRRTQKQFGLENAELRKNFSVRSETLGIHGILDFLLISENTVVPLEIKTGSGSPTKGQVLQLIAYGLCAEEMLGLTFSYGFLVVGNKSKNYKIEKTEKLLNEFQRVLTALQSDLKTMIVPDTPAKSHKCAQCEFLRFCNDRDLE